MIFFALISFVFLFSSAYGTPESYVFEQTVYPLSCEDTSVLVWRELEVFESTKNQQKSYYSRITLHVKNTGSKPLKDMVLVERVPDAVAKAPEEIRSFSITPNHLVQGSVVIEWLFDQVNAGEEKRLSYTVEKKLDESVLNQYEPPRVVSKAQGFVPKQETIAAETDWTVTLVVFTLLLILLGVGWAWLKRRENNL